MVLGFEFATREFLEYMFFCKFELRICSTWSSQDHGSVLLLIFYNDNSQRAYQRLQLGTRHYEEK